MRAPSHIEIRSFHPSMQNEVRRLITEGLAERFGFNDPAQNPDLDNIAATYGGATFLVAMDGGKIVGAGGLVSESSDTGRIVRMSVAASMRRKGIGSLILDRLIAAAIDAGYGALVLETTADWNDAISFYTSQGFEVLGIDGGRNEINLQRSVRA